MNSILYLNRCGFNKILYFLIFISTLFNSIYNFINNYIIVIDSYGNLWPPGLAEGRIASFGEYDECVGIKSPPEDGKIIYGKYCTLQVLLPVPKAESYKREYEEILKQKEYYKFFLDNIKIMNLDNYVSVNPVLKMFEGNDMIYGQMLRLGICVPHTCRPRDIAQVLNKSNYFLNYYFIIFLFKNLLLIFLITKFVLL